MREQVDSQELVIRPSWKHYKLMLKTTPAFLFVLIGAGVVRDGMAGLIFVGATVGLCVLAVVAYFRNAQVTLTSTELIRRGVPGRTIVRPRSDIAAVVRAILPVSAVDHRMYCNLFLLDQDGNRVLRLKNTHWAEADMTQLVNHLEIPTRDFWNPISIKEFTHHYPTALPLIERRPWAFALSTVSALVVVVTVVVLVVSANVG